MPVNGLFQLAFVSLFLFLAHSQSAFAANGSKGKEGAGPLVWDHGGIIRGPLSLKKIALVFTGGDFADGGEHIRKVLAERKIKAAFFFTGDFYRNPGFARVIRGLARDGHYLGPHSDKHLLYCPWEDREKTLVTKKDFLDDLKANYALMKKIGVPTDGRRLFIPPYEWFNNDISSWAKEAGVQIINFTPGTLSNADYTTPDLKNYRTSETIFKSILDHEKSDPHGLNGFIILVHIGTDPARTDKFYLRLDDLVETLERKGYGFERLDRLLFPEDRETHTRGKRH
jgi:peptidoglycan/xylan/chitin deacetylase (PgdA/CDA1 family)